MNDPAHSLKLGKRRVYRCACGAYCVRGVKARPHRCERCGGPLLGRPSAVEDARRWQERVARALAAGWQYPEDLPE